MRDGKKLENNLGTNGGAENTSSVIRPLVPRATNILFFLWLEALGFYKLS